MKVILKITILFLIISCSGTEHIEVTYKENDFSKIGWKEKGGFETKFDGSIYSKWGYIKGSEMAVILFEDRISAQDLGKKYGFEQTEMLEQPQETDENRGDTGSFYGKKVEKTDCRGFSGAALFRGECPRREPLYTVYLIDENLLLMLEPTRSENKESTELRLSKIISNLREKITAK
jgi:hypothetical protein